MPEQYKREEWIGRLIAALEAAAKKEDRATLAKLRRGLGKPVGQAADRDIWLYRHLAGAAPEQEEPAALVASLFALHPRSGGKRSLGAAFAGLKTSTNSDSTDKRFAVLLDSHVEDLPDRLRHAVSLLKSKDIPIDWAGLLDDLLRWNLEKRPVQRKWAREYWRKDETSSPGESSEVEPEAITN